MKMLRVILLFSYIILIPSWLHAEEPNAGFVQGLWYASEPVFAETSTRIYVALRNNTPHDLTATVRFSDNGKRLGSSEVRTLSGRLVEAWVDWTPTFGEHTITATVSDAELHIIGGGNRSIDISGIIAEDTLTVDYDTDKDGVGNATDTDDDSDGVSDTDEKERGSNPLVSNPTEKSIGTTKNESETNTTILETTPETRSDSERGLEKYIGEGTVHSLLGNVTEKVEGARQSLDSYRTQRNNELFPADIATTAKETTIGSFPEDATITRSKIETKNNFLSSLVAGIASLLQNVYTFVLWLFSRALSYPALIEFFFLIGMLYIIYRTVRRIGRRPNR